MKFWYKFGVLLAFTLTISTSYAWKEITITKGDSVKSIAQKYHQQGTSREEMMVAIRDANPHVFTQKGAGFKSGVRLMIPTSVNDVHAAMRGKYPALSTKVIAKSPAAPTPVKIPVNKPPANNKVLAEKPALAAKKISVNVNTSTVATTIKSLQDTVSSQTAAIQNYQNQINQLNGQLNIANQQVHSLESSRTEKIWTWGNLWLVLWLVTLAAFLVQYRKFQSLLATEPYDDHREEEPLPDDQEEPQIDAVEAHAPHFHELPQSDELFEEEPQEIDEVEEVEEEIIHEPFAMHEEDGRQEPHLTTSEFEEYEEAPKPRAISESWEQVELDIPIAAPTLEMEIPELRDLDKFEIKEAAVGEQQDIIDVLAQDEDNMEWHQALLEFYVKTNSQNGFKRHYQTMLKNGLMVEGDTLWEEVRKMYLNKWIYQTI